MKIDSDDLGKCIAHGIPVNRCPMCVYLYLQRLGQLCMESAEAIRAYRLRQLICDWDEGVKVLNEKRLYEISRMRRRDG